LKKFSLAFLSMIVLVSTFFASISFAATVGQQLTAPEAGWKRYDEKDLNIIYNDNWYNYVHTSDYNRSSTASEVNGKLVFTFVGTKIRIIGYRYPNHRATNNSINIDGIVETFSGRGTNTHQVLLYEKTGLTNERHTVFLEIGDEGNFDIDAIDVDEVGEITPYYKAGNLNASAGNSSVTLSWEPVPYATGYTIKYGTSPGQYSNSITVSESVYSGYTINDLLNGTTYYFEVSALLWSKNTGGSNEATATPLGPNNPEPEEPTGNRALLTIYITGGQIKEYDLSAAELSTFLNWFDAKDDGSGPTKYAFTKMWNKGPFKTRTEYVIFDKILTFDVDEYEVENP